MATDSDRSKPGKAWLLATLFCVVLAGPAGAGGLDRAQSEPIEIVGVYPNPVTDEDVGEFVVIEVPDGTDASGLALRDDESSVTISNGSVSGRVILSTEPVAAENVTGEPVHPLSGELSLANSGERIQLVRDGTPIDVVEYHDAPEGERYHRAGGQWEWQPLGATDVPIIVGGQATARLFVLPDAPQQPLTALRAADDRILLAGYTFTSDRVGTALIKAHRRGVHVEVLLESGPVGGMTTRQASALDRLVAAGIEVHVLGGERARYAYHHAKYAVIDNRSLVMTENWKPSGVGGRSSRGWGTIVRDRALTDGLASVFTADTGWKDTLAWARFRRNETFEPAEPSVESYPTRIQPETASVDRVQLLTAPDNAESALVGLLDNATEEIDVIQVSIAGKDGPFTKAVVRAARRGVKVCILLSNEWYVREENSAITTRLNRLAEQQGLPIEARLAEPAGRYEKIHTKGVIIDDDQVVIGSMNWNTHSARKNREIAVVLSGDAVGRYYSDAFEADWNGESASSPIPAGIIAVLGLLLVVALVLAKTIDFELRSE